MARATDALASSSARTATGQGTGILLDGTAESLAVSVLVTAVSGTTPSCTFTVEWSNDGTNWAQGDAADTFTAITATGNKVKSFTVKGLMARLVWTISGTTPSFTFSATGVATGSRSFA